MSTSLSLSGHIHTRTHARTHAVYLSTEEHKSVRRTIVAATTKGDLFAPIVFTENGFSASHAPSIKDSRRA